MPGFWKKWTSLLRNRKKLFPATRRPRRLLSLEELEPRIMLANDAMLPLDNPAQFASVLVGPAQANSAQSAPAPASAKPASARLASARPAREVFALPGLLGQTVPVRFTVTMRDAAFRNELGVVVVDDSSGRIGNLQPEDPGYAAAALAHPSRKVLFSGRPNAGDTKTVKLPARRHFIFYFVQNATANDFLARNPGNQLDKTPVVFFSIKRANPDGIRHMRENPANVFGFEDIAGGGDKDYNDIAVRMNIGTPTGTPAPPRLAGRLSNDTAPGGTTNTDRLTFDPSIAGALTAGRKIIRFRAGFDAALLSTYVSLLNDRGPGGSFLLDQARINQIAGGLLADGPHVLHLTAKDEANKVAILDLAFTLDTTVPLTFDLAAEFDSAPLGDRQTTFDMVTLRGQAEPGAVVMLQETGATTTAAGTGVFEFPGVDLTHGPNDFTVAATDVAGNSSTVSRTITHIHCGFDSGLTDWTVAASGGAPPGQGSVTVDGTDAVLREGNSLLVTLERNFTVPAEASQLKFIFSGPAFDTADIDSIKDAFEVALLDAGGAPLVFPFDPGRDAFFNISEGQTPALGIGTSIDGQTVTTALSALTAGGSFRLVFRLVNNDSDTETTVRINCVEVVSGGSPPPAGIPGSRASLRTNQALDFALLSDVSESLETEYFRTSFDEAERILNADLAVHNNGQYEVAGPLLAVVRNLSDPTVRVRDADGRTPDGLPYYDFTDLLANGRLLPGDTTLNSGESSYKRVAFFSPDGAQFSYDLVFLAQLNRAPAFTSVADVEALALRRYVYQATAADPDGDTLAYALLLGPAGMAIDGASGQITWDHPTANEVGNHAVAVRVEDGRGGFDLQHFTLAVRDNVPNRPPVFTSTPVVEANVNTLYRYQAAARDEDGDPLTFALATGPADMAVEADSGLVSWTPSGAQAGPQDVTLTVSDGRGGTATQVFTVIAGIEPGNHPPVIFSDPVTQISLVDTTGNPILLDLTAGESATETVSFTLPDGLVPGMFADIAFVVDRASSMADEYAWLAEMVRELDATLQAQGVGPNRFSLAGFNRFLPTPVGHVLYLDGLAHDRVTIYGPDNRLLGSGSFGPVFTDPLSFRLPNAGPYTVVVSADPALGQHFYQMRVDSDLARAVATTGFGEAHTGTLAAGEVKEFTYTAPAVLPVYFDSLDNVAAASVDLLDPDGQNASSFGTRSDFGPFLLSKAGAYTLRVRYSATQASSFSFRVLDLTAGQLITTGETVQATLASGSEAHVYRLAGARGQRLFLDGLALGGAFSGVDVTLFSPSLARVTHSDFFGNIGPFVLTEDGDHYLVASSLTAPVGREYSFRVLDLADAEPLALDAEASGVLDPGQGSRVFTFQGTAGQQLYLDALAGSMFTGSSLFGAGSSAVATPNAEFETTLPADGRYDLIISGGLTTPAAYRFRLVTPDSEVRPLSLGQLTAGRIAEPGETDVYTFSAAAGQQVYYDALSGPVGVVSTATLLAPSGQSVLRGDVRSELGLATLPETGVYRLAIDLLNDATGDYQFRLLDVTGAALPAAVGSVVGATLETPQATDVYRLDLTADQRLYFDWLSVTGTVTVSLVDPSGRTVQSRSGPFDGEPFHVGRTGAYLLVVSGAGGTAYSFRLHDAAAASPVVFGATVSSSFDPGREAHLFRIDAAAGQRLHFDDLTAAGLRAWNLYSPGNRSVGVPVSGGDLEATPGQAGTYLLVFAGNQAAPFDFSFRVSADDQAPVAPSGFNTPYSGTLQSGQVHSFTLTGTAGMTIYADSLDSTAFGILWGLTAPSGAYVFSPRGAYFDPGTFILAESGTYTLTLSGSGSYNVRLLDLATAATDFTVGSLVSGTLDPGTRTDVHRFTAAPGQLLLVRGVDGLSTASFTPLAHDLSALTRPGSRNNDPYLITLGGDTYLLVQGTGLPAIGYTFQVLDLAAAPAAPLDAVVDSTLNPGRAPLAYSVSAAAGQRLFFDSLSSSSSFFWGLYDRSGRVLVAPSGLENDFTFTSAQAEDFALVLEGFANPPVTVSFRIVTSDTTSTPLTLGAMVSGSLAEPGEIDEYTFQGTPGQRLFFDSIAAVDAKWVRMIAPSGQQVFSNQLSLDVNGVFLREAGTYRLAVDALGRELTGAYSFRLFDEADVPELLPGVDVSGRIDDVNETDVYRFQGTAGQRIWLDVVSPDLSSALLTLRTPAGEVVYQGGVADAGPFTLPESGSYELTVSGRGVASGIGTYALRLVDASAAPVLPQPVVTGTLETLRHTAVYRIEARAGDVLTLRPGEDTTWGTAEALAAAASALSSSFGVTADGYDAIEAALTGLTYRPGAATRVVLITQNSRFNIDLQLDANTILHQLSAAGAAVTVVVPNALHDGQGNAVLGLGADGTNYRADGTGGVILGTGSGVDTTHTFDSESSPWPLP
ncbi:MAG: DUF4114 domain-containing protein, partial [Planctomycetes bacterium]|nr:DUF4114 domain-containing protein [Planctomycetota bacterium]